MKSANFGVLLAGAIATLVGSGGVAGAEQASGGDKACYRKQCGKSIKGYEGQCGGTKVDSISDPGTCEKVGGAWTTAAEAATFKKHG